MRFLNSLSDQLAAMEREMQAFSGDLDSMVRRFDQGKWDNMLLRVNENFSKLLDKLSAPRISGVFPLPLIFDPQSFSITPVTSEDRARWRAARKSEIRIVIGKGQVQVMAASEITGKGETAVSHRIPFGQQQGHIILNWDQYQKLLDEIGKLISGNAG
ncbi:hypothetical protein ACFLV4_08190 [Chloroflexota bacterium]